VVLVDCCAFTSEALELPVLDWLLALASGVVAALLLGVVEVELVALLSGVVLLDGVVDWLLALVSGVVELPVEVVEDCELISVLLVLGVVAAVLPGVLVALVSGVVLLDGVVDWLLALASGVVLVDGVVDWLLALVSGVVLLLDEVVEDCELMSVLLVLGVVAALADWSGVVLVAD